MADHQLTCFKILSCWRIHLQKIVTEWLHICDMKNDLPTQYWMLTMRLWISPAEMFKNLCKIAVQILPFEKFLGASTEVQGIFLLLSLLRDFQFLQIYLASVISVTTFNFWNKAFLRVYWNSKALSSCLTSLCNSWKLNCKEECQCIEIIIFHLPIWDKNRLFTHIHKW